MPNETVVQIPQERMSQIKELSEFQQRYIVDIYTHALRVAEEGTQDQILAMLDHDIQTLLSEQNQEVPTFNEVREEGFAQLVEKLNALLELDPSGKKMEQWLVGALNNIFKFKDQDILFQRDFSSVHVIFATSATAAAISGRETVRPILIFDDPSQLEKIMQRFGGGESTNGMFLPISGRGELPAHVPPGYAPLARAGLLLSRKGKEDTMGHEIRHSIDPLVKTRRGFNEILTELFAFATQVGLRRDVLTRMLNHPAYIDANLAYEEKQDERTGGTGYAKKSYFGIEEKSEDVHRLFVETALDTFFGDCEKMGVIKALRRVGKSADLQSYFSTVTQMRLRKKR